MSTSSCRRTWITWAWDARSMATRAITAHGRRVGNRVDSGDGAHHEGERRQAQAVDRVPGGGGGGEGRTWLAVFRVAADSGAEAHCRRHQPGYVHAALPSEMDRGAGAGGIDAGRYHSRGGEGVWRTGAGRYGTRPEPLHPERSIQLYSRRR